MSMPVWAQVLLPVASVAITALVTWQVAQRRIAIENITQERAKWRSSIRRKALAAHDAMVAESIGSIERLRNEFRALLNPYDVEDRKLVDCLAGPKGTAKASEDEFAVRVSLLLKHDWERAKWEARPFKWFRHEPPRQTTCKVGALKRDEVRADPRASNGWRWRRLTLIVLLAALWPVLLAWPWSDPAARIEPKTPVTTQIFVFPVSNAPAPDLPAALVVAGQGITL